MHWGLTIRSMLCPHICNKPFKFKSSASLLLSDLSELCQNCDLQTDCMLMPLHKDVWCKCATLWLFSRQFVSVFVCVTLFPGCVCVCKKIWMGGGSPTTIKCCGNDPPRVSKLCYLFAVVMLDRLCLFEYVQESSVSESKSIGHSPGHTFLGVILFYLPRTMGAAGTKATLPCFDLSDKVEKENKSEKRNIRTHHPTNVQ